MWRRTIAFVWITGVLASGQALALINNTGNCDGVPKSQWGKCVIELSTERGGSD